MDLTALEAVFTLHNDLTPQLTDLAAGQTGDRSKRSADATKKERAAADKQVTSALERVLGARDKVSSLLKLKPGEDASLSGLLVAVTRPFFMKADDSEKGVTTHDEGTPAPKRPKRVVKNRPK